MSNIERGGQMPLNPHNVMDDLLLRAELRFGEALRNQEQDPYSVWFTEGTDPETHEYLAWYRVGASRELEEPGAEILDIGMVVLHAAGVLTIAAQEANDEERHFYVAKPQVRNSRMMVSERNSLSVIRERRQRVRHGVDVTPISGLSRKLDGSYPVRPLRVRHET